MNEIYSLLWLNSELNLPRDRATINAWLRSFAATNSLVSDTLQFLCLCATKFIKTKSEIDLPLALIESIVKEYFLFGEVYLHKSDSWKSCEILNPDYIVVNKNADSFSKIFLRPNEHIRSAVLNKNRTLKQEEMLLRIDKDTIGYIQRGENIPLDYKNCWSMLSKTSSYDVRGTSLFLPVFRDLMLLEKYNISLLGKIPEELEDMIALTNKVKISIAHPDCFVSKLEIFNNKSKIFKDVLLGRMYIITNELINFLEEKYFDYLPLDQKIIHFDVEAFQQYVESL